MASKGRRSRTNTSINGKASAPSEHSRREGNALNLPEEFKTAQVIEQGPTNYSPGFTKRALRVKEWKYLVKLGLKRDARNAGQVLKDAEAEEQANDAWERFEGERYSEALLAEFEATAPSSTAPEGEIDREVEAAAALRLGPVRWLGDFLTGKTNRRGFSAKRSLVAQVFLRMAFTRGKPEIAQARNELLRGNTLASWAHDYPDGGPTRNHFYESLHVMLKTRSTDALVHVNFEAFKQLAELRDSEGNLRHPEAGKVAVFDGCLIQADVQQRSPNDPEHRALLIGPGRENVAPVLYADSKGRVRRFVVGYKLCCLQDLDTQQVMAFCICPANCDERKVCLHLLETLFQLWPDCPLETLLADALHSNDIGYLRKLIFDWGVQPCFPDKGVTYRPDLPHRDTQGVPKCHCGGLMKLLDVDPGLKAQSRAKKGIRRGERGNIDARLRWICKNKRCKNDYTKPWDDPRLYTVLPRQGEHRTALRRTALEVRRNAIESYFASIQRLGLIREDLDRPSWVNQDHEMDWLIGAGICFLTARRLAHETGLYDSTYAEAYGLGLLDQPSHAVPAPGPTELELVRALRAREALLGPPVAPRTWADSDRAVAA